MLTANDVAKFILAQSDPEEGDIISPLKLQKLVYYCQGFHLAEYNEPLFSEQIVAWDHGPVVESLYQFYKDYSRQAIPLPDEIDFDIYTTEQKKLMEEIYRIFGQFSAWKLRNMTHDEPPWKNANRNEVISHEAMMEYFKTQLED